MAQSTVTDQAILEATLFGLQYQLTQVDTKIAEIRRKLGIRAPRFVSATDEPQPVRKRRKLSPAARKRIADATRRRWAEYRAAKAGSKKWAA